MKGSEKQINWAKDIQRNVVSVLESAISEAKSQAEGKPEVAAKFAVVLDKYTALLHKVADFDGYAGDMIDVFGLVKDSGVAGFKQIQAALRSGDPDHIFH